MTRDLDERIDDLQQELDDLKATRTALEYEAQQAALLEGLDPEERVFFDKAAELDALADTVPTDG